MPRCGCHPISTVPGYCALVIDWYQEPISSYTYYIIITVFPSLHNHHAHSRPFTNRRLSHRNLWPASIIRGHPRRVYPTANWQHLLATEITEKRASPGSHLELGPKFPVLVIQDASQPWLMFWTYPSFQCVAGRIRSGKCAGFYCVLDLSFYLLF